MNFGVGLFGREKRFLIPKKKDEQVPMTPVLSCKEAQNTFLHMYEAKKVCVRCLGRAQGDFLLIFLDGSSISDASCH